MRKEEIWSIQKDIEINRVIGEILSKAKTSVCFITTEVGLVIFNKEFGKVLDELAEKKVQIRIEVPVDSSNASFVRELRYVYQVKNLQVTVPMLLVIVDENKLLLASLKTDDQQTKSNRGVGLFSQDGNLSAYIFSLLGFDRQ